MADQTEARRHLELGDALAVEMKYAEACEEYGTAAEIDPNYALAYHNWGNALNKQGRYAEAAAKHRKATEIDPNYALAYNNWANALYNSKKYAEAAEKYRRATEIDPDYSIAYDNWGDALFKLEKYAEAVEKYRRATEIDANFAAAYNNWGNASVELGKFSEAFEKYQKAVESGPAGSVNYFKWGAALLQQGKKLEAIEKCRMAAQLDPGNAEAYERWIDALQKQEPRETDISRKTMGIDPEYVKDDALSALRAERRRETETNVTNRPKGEPARDQLNPQTFAKPRYFSQLSAQEKDEALDRLYGLWERWILSPDEVRVAYPNAVAKSMTRMGWTYWLPLCLTWLILLPFGVQHFETPETRFLLLVAAAISLGSAIFKVGSRLQYKKLGSSVYCKFAELDELYPRSSESRVTTAEVVFSKEDKSIRP